MQIENVARKSLTPRWTAQQQRHLAIGHSVLGQIVVNHQRVTFVIAEIFAHRGAGVRRQIEQGSRVARAGRHDNRLVHHAFTLECLN
jgi:hypothetical protein